MTQSNMTFVGRYDLTQRQQERWVSDAETKLAFRLTEDTNPVYLDKKNIDNIMSILHILKEVESASIRVELIDGTLKDSYRDTAATAGTNRIDGFEYEWEQPVQERKSATRYWTVDGERYTDVSVRFDPDGSQWGTVRVYVNDST